MTLNLDLQSIETILFRGKNVKIMSESFCLLTYIKLFQVRFVKHLERSQRVEPSFFTRSCTNSFFLLKVSLLINVPSVQIFFVFKGKTYCIKTQFLKKRVELNFTLSCLRFKTIKIQLTSVGYD